MDEPVKRDIVGAGTRAAQGTDSVVVVPVKAFELAKARLAPVIGPQQRALLARRLATGVLGAAAPHPVAVVCEDEGVARWARDLGAAVVWTPGLGLNGAVNAALDRLASAGVTRAVVVHSDLPFAAGIGDLARTADQDVVLVPDRHHDGTNVLSVPVGRGFQVSYGPGSFRRHCTEAARCGLRCVVVEDEALGWDVDGPGDLSPPAHLGTLELT